MTAYKWTPLLGLKDILKLGRCITYFYIGISEMGDNILARQISFFVRFAYLLLFTDRYDYCFLVRSILRILFGKIKI